IKSLRMERINVQELHDMLLSDPRRPVIVDVRSPMTQAQGRIPGAITLSVGDAELSLITDGKIIVYCDCPNDASAAAVSKRLMDSGYSRVRPLAGGIDAWLAAGYEVETDINADAGVPA